MYYQIDEDVVAVRSIIIEAESEEEAWKVWEQMDEEYLTYETYESLGTRLSEHLFKPILN